MGILNEIKINKQKKFWRYFVVFLLLVSLASYFFFFQKKQNEKETRTYVVSKKTIISTFSSDGKVKYKDQYDLNFPISGTLANIHKKEGDNVKKGEIIASLDDKYLKINLDKAQISLNTAIANLNSKLGIKTSDINVSQKQLESSKVSLDANIRQGKIDLENASKTLNGTKIDLENAKNSTQKDVENSIKLVESANKDLSNAKDQLQTIIDQENLNIRNTQNIGMNTINSTISSLEKYLRDIDIIAGITDQNKNINDEYEVYLGAKDSSTKDIVEKSFNDSLTKFNNFKSSWNSFKNNPDLNNIKAYIIKLQDISSSIKTSLESTRNLLKNSITSVNLSQQQLDSMIANIEADISSLQNEIQNIINSSQNIDSAELSLNTKTLNQNNSIMSLEIKFNIAKVNLEKAQISAKSTIDNLEQNYILEQNNYDSVKIKLDNNVKLSQSQIDISQANLDLRRSNFSEKELEPFNIAIENAKKGLEEAQKRLEDASLKSPIDGIVGKLSATKMGTIINQIPENPFVTIINKNSLYVEANIEEGDIPNIKLNQAVRIGFNSLENVMLTGAVSFIGDKSSVDQNGIVTYKVEVLFDKLDPQVKEGFTSQIYFILETHKDTLTVPIETVKEENGKSYVILKNGKKQIVQTGINDTDYVEILNGLSEGDIINY